MTPEGKVKRWIHEFMINHFPGLYHYSPPGVHRYGQNGTPDRFYLWNGVFVAIEAKANPNDRPTNLQLHALRRIAANGGVAAVVKGKDIERMEAIKREILRRVRLANEGSGLETIRSPEGDSGVPTKTQT